MNLLNMLPGHEASLSITHNQHKDYYESVSQYLANVDDSEFVKNDSKAVMMATNEVWECQWYPNTPVGFNRVYAATFQDLIEYFAKESNEN